MDWRFQMSVRAKLRVDSIEGNKLVMTTVYEPDAAKDIENARFTKATPWGRVEMGIDNPAALAQFKVGSYYYADFNEVPAT
jgi:hypothetical protein